MTFSLRPWHPDDIPGLVRYANNLNIAQNLTNRFPHPYSEADAQAFIAMATADDPVHIFAIDINGEAVGGIGVHPQGDVWVKNAELGYWLAEPFWGKGIVSGAIRQAVDFAFETYDIDRVFARPFGTNIGSQKALEKNGFQLEGRFEKVLLKNGVYHDELVYAVRREGWER
jgi:[ribosomal protein S5]-alanine N-acetyltransferase